MEKPIERAPKIDIAEQVEAFLAWKRGETIQGTSFPGNPGSWVDVYPDGRQVLPHDFTIRRKPTPASPLDGLRALARQWRNNVTVKRLVGYERSAFENCAAQLEETVNVIEADHPELRPK